MTAWPASLLRHLLVVAVAVAVGLAAAPVVAADPADAAAIRAAEGKATEAKIMFQQKQFAAAAELFFQAYAIVKRPSLLYNAARANEEAGNIDKAVALYKSYRETQGVDEGGRTEATARIAKLQKAIDDRDAAIASAKAEKERAEKQRLAAEQELRDQQARDLAQRERAAKDKELKDKLAKAEAAAKLDAKRPFPVMAAAATGSLVVVGGGLYGAALSQAAAAHALEPTLQSRADGDAYFGHVQNATTLRNAAIAAGVLGAGCAAWFVWELVTPPPPPVAPKTTIIRPTARSVRPQWDHVRLTFAPIGVELGVDFW